MTTRLYYTDPYQIRFSAAVTRCEPRDGGAVVTLDQTAFYPTSGGQPFDVGTLGEARVLDVQDLDDGEIAHVVDRPVPLGPIAGEIDWVRRFDHMQQHTGQHVLSAAFVSMCRARTESFHMGADVSTIDLSATLAADAIARAASEANRVVWEDRPVHVRFASAEDAASMPLRKEPTRTGALRLVEVEGFDLSACGGTHVARTGGIGVIAVSGWERYKGGTRVSFVCGARALRSFEAMRDVQAAAVRLLSVHTRDLPEAIERLQTEARDLRRQVKAEQGRLAALEAAGLRARAVRIGDRMIVVEILEGWDADGLKQLASAIAAEAGYVAALLSAGDPRMLVIARAVDVKLDAGAVLRRIAAEFGGRGGGRPELAQGGGMRASDAALVEAVRNALSA